MSPDIDGRKALKLMELSILNSKLIFFLISAQAIRKLRQKIKRKITI